MAVKLRVKRTDPILREIVGALNEYGEGHPESHGQPSIRSRVRSSSSPCMSNSGRLNPIPPG